MSYQIRFLPEAEADLLAISDRRIRAKIIERIERLVVSPETQGKLLQGELADFRSIRAVGQRYRIIYEVRKEVVTVLVVAVGIRKRGDKRDVYAKTKRRKAK